MNNFKRFGVMIDCSRNSIINVKTFKKMVDYLSCLGYNSIMLYMEDTYEIKNEPYFGYLRGRYSYDELKEMDDYAYKKNIELIPCIQTLAHLATIFRYKEYIQIKDIDDILLVNDTKTYNLIDHMFLTFSECFRSKKIHIGMDEAFNLGKGKYLDKYGLESKTNIMKKHLDMVLKIAAKYDFECEMWGDMFYNEAYENNQDNHEIVKEKINPKIKLCCWDYYLNDVKDYENKIEKYLKLTSNVSFAGGTWTWTGYCPNNRYSLKVTREAIKACLNKNIQEFYLTMWGDNGGECSPLSAMITLLAASEFAKNNFDIIKIKQIFKEKIGMDYDDFTLLESLDTIYGYQENCNDPSKVMLFTDLFFNIFETKIVLNKAKPYYQKISRKLFKHIYNKDFGYLFEMEYYLAKVLEIKFDISKITKIAYENKDYKKLSEIANKTYPLLAKRLSKFYESLRKMWLIERKPFGFEIQDIRIGGVIQRIKYCQSRLNDFINSKISIIEELEEKILEPFGLDLEGIEYNYYGVLPTANNI